MELGEDHEKFTVFLKFPIYGTLFANKNYYYHNVVIKPQSYI